MADTVISAESLSKRYLVGHRSARQESYLRDVIARSARNFARKAVDFARGRQIVPGDGVEEFWALKDASFEVKRGEVVGIIGRNGAGKSTLLKILSRITDPTEGRVRVRGRVASLLEVGTGFHPELTGRENISLNGAILGMSQREIRGKFDEIVTFAEVEKFLDTPVKHYSSGMYMRLAFAVAAHLEPEILVVDEVLAVGDADFQKKCLGKMSEVAIAGRTILFVSHNLSAVARICSRVMILAQGHVQAIHDHPEEAISEYLGANGSDHSRTWRNSGDLSHNEYFIPVELSANLDSCPQSVDMRITFKIRGQLLRNHSALVVALAIHSIDGSVLFWTSARDRHSEKWMRLGAGPLELWVNMPISLLNEGDYYAELAVMLHNQKFLVSPGAGPKVYFSIPPKITNSEFWDCRRQGYLAPILSWGWDQLTIPLDEMLFRK
jgi:lipopolysaccharide transport system ATP-binding protein